MRPSRPREEPKRRRRVVFVEYDITDMTDAQVHALLLVLASSRGTSFHVEVEDRLDAHGAVSGPS